MCYTIVHIDRWVSTRWDTKLVCALPRLPSWRIRSISCAARRSGHRVDLVFFRSARCDSTPKIVGGWTPSAPVGARQVELRFIREKNRVPCPRRIRMKGWCKRLCTPKYHRHRSRRRTHRNTSVNVIMQATWDPRSGEARFLEEIRAHRLSSWPACFPAPRRSRRPANPAAPSQLPATAPWVFASWETDSASPPASPATQTPTAAEGEIQGKETGKGKRHGLAVAHPRITRP